MKKNSNIVKLSVYDLNNKIKDLFNNSYKNVTLSVLGEISNYKTFNSNIYFTLKDESSTLSCCIWNNNGISSFKNGDKVEVTGKLMVYVKSGQYQLNVSSVKNIGNGNIYESFEKLKLYYKNLGYFDKPKKQLHPYIDNICVITAQNGAALQDFLSVLQKNNYTGMVSIKNAIVQGKECAKSIANALDYVNRLNFDVVVITRGGGSYEDLNGFNSSQIIESLNNINTITISAIGHEVDTVLTDYVADIRAATPTMAASMITSNLIKPGYYFNILNKRKNKILQKIKMHQDSLNQFKLNIVHNETLLHKYKLQLNTITNSSSILIKRKLNLYYDNLKNLQNEFKNITDTDNHKSIVTIIDKDNNKVVSKKQYEKNIQQKIKMKIIFFDGVIAI